MPASWARRLPVWPPRVRQKRNASNGGTGGAGPTSLAQFFASDRLVQALHPLGHTHHCACEMSQRFVRAAVMGIDLSGDLDHLAFQTGKALFDLVGVFPAIGCDDGVSGRGSLVGGRGRFVLAGCLLDKLGQPGPRVIPARCADAFAASRAGLSTPLTLHGVFDVMAAPVLVRVLIVPVLCKAHRERRNTAVLPTVGRTRETVKSRRRYRCICICSRRYVPKARKLQGKLQWCAQPLAAGIEADGRADYRSHCFSGEPAARRHGLSVAGRQGHRTRLGDHEP